jgi:hypothetical protein
VLTRLRLAGEDQHGPHLRPTTLDLPRQLLPLDVLGRGSNRTEDIQVPTAVAVLDPDGEPVAVLPLLLDRRVESFDDAGDVISSQMFGEDPSGAMQVTVTGTRAMDGYQIGLLYAEPPNADPETLAPALAFAVRSHQPHVLALVLPSGRQIRAAAPFPAEQDPEGLMRLDFVEGLAYVNGQLEEAFLVPTDISAQDIRDLNKVRRLLNAETLVERWRDVTVGLRDADVQSWLDDPHRHGWRLQVETPLTVSLLNRDLDLGRAQHTFRSVKPAGHDRQPSPEERMGDGALRPLLLEPASSDVVETKLVGLIPRDRATRGDILRAAAATRTPPWPSPDEIDPDELDAAIRETFDKLPHSQ